MRSLFTGLSYQLSSASTHSLPSRIDQLSDSENDYEAEEEEEFDSSSALDEGTPTKRLHQSIENQQSSETISGRKSPTNRNHTKPTIALRASW